MWNNQKQQKIVFPYVKLTNYHHFKLDLQKVDEHILDSQAWFRFNIDPRVCAS